MTNKETLDKTTEMIRILFNATIKAAILSQESSDMAISYSLLAEAMHIAEAYEAKLISAINDEEEGTPEELAQQQRRKAQT